MSINDPLNKYVNVISFNFGFFVIFIIFSKGRDKSTLFNIIFFNRHTSTEKTQSDTINVSTNKTQRKSNRIICS